MVNLDIARTESDFHQCRELLERTNPGAPAPAFGSPGSVTFVIYDHERRDVVRGCIHADMEPVVRAMAVDPDYRFQDASFTMLHQFMEAHLRVAGYRQVFHDVPMDKSRIIRTLEKCGAAEVDVPGGDSIRMRKEL